MEFIQLRDALTEMESLVDGRPRRFNVTVISYDEQRGTGGEILEFNEVSLSEVKFAQTSTVPEEFKRQQPAARIALSKNPNHRENKTKNLRLKNGQIRKIHIRFITHYNGLKILY